MMEPRCPFKTREQSITIPQTRMISFEPSRFGAFVFASNIKHTPVVIDGNSEGKSHPNPNQSVVK